LELAERPVVVQLDQQPCYSHPANQATGLICDQNGNLKWLLLSQSFPVPLRRVKYIDPKKQAARILDQPIHAACYLGALQ